MSENAVLIVLIGAWTGVQLTTVALKYRAAQKAAGRKTAKEQASA